MNTWKNATCVKNVLCGTVLKDFGIFTIKNNINWGIIMKSLLEKDLRKMVLEVIKDIPSNYRCYEITRTLKREFLKKGIGLEVKDGYVFYCFQTFLTEKRMGNCAIYLRNLENINEIKTASRISTRVAIKQKDLRKSLLWRIVVSHSWCILSKEKYLIDCHRSIKADESKAFLFKKFPILKELWIKNFLMITPLKKLPDECGYIYNNVIYVERAFQKGDVIHYKDGEYVTELRL